MLLQLVLKPVPDLPNYVAAASCLPASKFTILSTCSLERVDLQATEFYGLPDMVPMHGGLPPATAFPIESMSLHLKDGTVVDIVDPALVPLHL